MRLGLTARAYALTSLIALVMLLAPGNRDAWAQAVCSNSPQSGERVECTEDQTSTSNIGIDLDGVDVDTSASSEHAVSASHAGSGNVMIDISSSGTGDSTTRSDLATTGNMANAIRGRHTGSSGNVDISVSNTDIVTGTSGGSTAADGIFAERGVDQDAIHPSTQPGDLLTSISSSTITVHGASSSSAILAQHRGSGKLEISLTDSTLTSTGYGVYGQSLGQCPESSGSSCYAKIDSGSGVTITAPYAIQLERNQQGSRTYLPTNGIIEVNGNTITAVNKGISNSTSGVRPGDATTTVTDTKITTSGASADAVFSQRSDTGDQTINLVCTDSPAAPCEIKTGGTLGFGIEALSHAGASGDIRINVQGDYAIDTESTGMISTQNPFTAAHGIVGHHKGTGDVHINAQDGSITTAGTLSYGIIGWQKASSSTGDINISTGTGNSITTTGPSGHGIVTYHVGTAATGRSMVTVGGSINVSGAGARGVQMGRLSGDAPGRVAGLDANGYRRQTVTVNGAITSAAEGVFLAGGGRVILGPSGSITSGSDIAILATGTVPAVADDPQTIGIDESMAAIAPKLRVDLNPGGAQMAGTGNWLAAALGGGWILNDGGGTAIYVNGEKLHDADTGVVANAVARNGAWDVTMQAQGVKVSDRSTDPWTFSARAAGVIADRDFNAEDFMEVAMVARCPAGMVGTPPNCTTPSPPPPPPPPPPDPGPPEPAPEPGSGSIPEFEPAEPAGPVLVETYAPRAALYEALPEFLLGLHTQAGALHSLRTPDLPVWMELSASTGEHDPARSTVGAHFDAEHLVVRAGGQILQGRHHRVRASVHHVSATADVSSPVRGGDLRARGKGLSLDAHYHHGNGSYATGRAAWTDYTLEASSDTVGRLVSGVEAERMDLRVETGHRLHWGAGVHWSPHLRLHHTRLSVERFTDAVGARVSFPQTERYRASLGLMADRTYGAAGGQGVLWGALHLEHAFRDTDTRATVSGETLEATPEQNRVHLSAGLLWEYGPWVLESALAWHRANADSQAYAARLNVGVRF